MSKDELGPQFIALGNRNVDVIPTGHGKEPVMEKKKCRLLLGRFVQEEVALRSDMTHV